MMQTGPVISIIIPVYNVEKYITQCIESVIHQTYSNLEIILIDDGSLDQGGMICDSYKELDGRIQVLHKINGGLSDARNAGLKLITGEYVMFVDSDDWIDLEMVERLYELILKYDADMSVCSYKCIADDAFFHRDEESASENVWFYCGQEGLDAFLCRSVEGMSGAVWGQLIRHVLLDGLMFPYGKTYEDIVYNTVLFSRSARTVYCNNKYYNYRIKRDGSITGTHWTKKNLEDYHSLLNEKIEFLQSIGKGKLAEYTVYDGYIMFLDVYIKSLTKDEVEYLSSVLKEYQPYIVHSIRRKNEGVRKRILIGFSIPFPILCRIMYILIMKSGILKLFSKNNKE